MQITARRFTSLSSCPRFRKEFFEVSNAALQSCNQLCWSSSAAVSFDSFSSQHGRKKVTKQERSAMVFAFVEKYRALNGGKFPTVSITQKQVGGSYYVVREIIQELEHNHKTARLETRKETKIRGENTKCEDFSLTKEPSILAYAEQTSFKVYVGDTTEGAITSRLSVESHSDDQIKIDAHKKLTPSRVSKDKGLGFDKLHLSTSPAIEKPHAQTSGTSDTETMKVGHQVSAKPTSTEEIEACGEDAASAFNLHKEAFRSEELYDGGQSQKVEQRAPSAKRSIFWDDLKSFIISLWKK